MKVASLKSRDFASQGNREARSARLAGLQQPIPELTTFLEIQNAPVTSVDFSPDGVLLASPIGARLPFLLTSLPRYRNKWHKAWKVLVG